MAAIMAHRQGQNFYKSGPTSPTLKFSSSFSIPKKPTYLKPRNALNIQYSSNSSKRPAKFNLIPASKTVKMPSSTTSSSSSKSSSSTKRSADEAFSDTNSSGSSGTTELDELLANLPKKKARFRSTSIPVTSYERRKLTEDNAAKNAAAKKKDKKKEILKRVAKVGWANMPASAQRGLRNITGVLCYRLSVLQSLLHQPAFVHWVQRYHSPLACANDDRTKCVTCMMYRFTTTYWCQGSTGLVKILREMDALFNNLGWKPDVQSDHADPDEHINWIIKMMKEELPAETAASLDDVFAVATSSVVTCGKCGLKSTTHGHNDRTLSVPIAPRIPRGGLDDYLEKYMIETISGYTCSSCKKVSSVKRTMEISSAPAILAVTLKRYDHFGRKVKYDVPISSHLDLSSYAHDDEKLQYELTAVINHTGGAAFGHYVCHAKGPDGWNCYNDEDKSRSNVETAIENKAFTPYVLYFKRV